MNKFLIHLSWVLLLVLQVGCSGGGHQDLVQYMREIRERPARPIEPIPSFKEYHSHTYGSAGGRSPFEQPVEIDIFDDNGMRVVGDRAVQPDPARIKEYLESFSISAINMVGTIAKGDRLWALVDDGTGNIHRVQEDNYMGRNHGRIVSVNNIQISLIEIVPDGLSGWVERPKLLRLVESED